MSDNVERRQFLKHSAAAAIAAIAAKPAWSAPRRHGEPLFNISLAEWSLHRALSATR